VSERPAYFAATDGGLAVGQFRRRAKHPAVVVDGAAAMLSPDQLGGVAGVLTENELAVLWMMADGRRKPEMADALELPVRALNAVCHSLYGKLGARNDVHAVAIGFRRGVIALDRRSETNSTE